MFLMTDEKPDRPSAFLSEKDGACFTAADRCAFPERAPFF